MTTAGILTGGLFTVAGSAAADTAVMLGVVGLLGVSILLFTALIALRLLITRGEELTSRKEDEIRPLIYELLTSDRLRKDIILTLRSVIPLKDRPVLERVLLENARLLKGREMEILTAAFEELGYVDEDIRNLSRRDRIKKAELAFHLGTMRTARAVPFLVEALSDPNPEVQFSCMNALSKIGTPEALDAVMEHLSSSTGLETLRVAEVVLERKQSFSPYLERWLERGEQDTARLLLIIDLVGAMKDDGAVPLVLPYLRHHDAEVRAAAARALGGIGDFMACKSLTTAMDDPDAGVRAAAAEALGKIQCEDSVGRLGRALGDPDLTVKMNSAVSLSQFGAAGSATLLAGLDTEEDVDREIVAEVLEREKLNKGAR